ncbi:MAG: hypothetical protein GXO91_10195, partial [FCB group bacterium]|nr:hypothetical protein [FCB group bacterium]
HYDGSSFEQMESGTDVDLLGISGSGESIWVCGYKDFEGAVVLEYRNNSFETVYQRTENISQINPDSLSGKTMNLWTNTPDSVNVLTPIGIYRIGYNSEGAAHLISQYWQGFPWSIGGNSNNDIFTAGDFSSVYHYNGSTFQRYTDFSGRISTQSIDMKNDIVCLVGLDYETGRAIVVRGHR